MNHDTTWQGSPAMIDASYIGLLVSGAATVSFYAWNSGFRAAVDQAAAPIKVPERSFGYSANDLVSFREVASRHPTKFGRSALDLYRDSVLCIDIGFAISLSLFSFLCWYIAAQRIDIPVLQSVALIGQMAAFIYGLSDVAEDVTLRLLLAPHRQIRVSDATRASTLTLLKMLSLCASLVGFLVFIVLVLLFRKR
ncbi:hypothetical protein [Tardiphaga sp. OK246]|uniref:hypothetical protein n=1 Tax=Tardiphaga sp. OK246 TaxID=1855307 RepID=UPI00113199FE|nr:hypothetical protein [Tardiphaga sp. OK246]